MDGVPARIFRTLSRSSRCSSGVSREFMRVSPSYEWSQLRQRWHDGLIDIPTFHFHGWNGMVRFLRLVARGHLTRFAGHQREVIILPENRQDFGFLPSLAADPAT